MNRGLGYIFYTLASVCFVSGLLVLTGGATGHGEPRGNYIHD